MKSGSCSLLIKEIRYFGIGKDYSVNEYYAIATSVFGFKGFFAYQMDKPVGMKQMLVSISKQTAWARVQK